jgi:hypothetical protein
MNRITTEFGRGRPSVNRIPLALVPVALLVVSLFATPAAASAADLDVDQSFAASNKHTGTCSLATLQGRYLFADKGTLLPPAFGVTTPTLAADAGFEVFNGDGTGKDTVTLRVNDKVVFHNIVVDTTYTLNQNCTGTITVKGGPTFDIFVAPDGEMFSSIATDPGNYPSRIELRASSK